MAFMVNAISNTGLLAVGHVVIKDVNDDADEILVNYKEFCKTLLKRLNEEIVDSTTPGFHIRFKDFFDHTGINIQTMVGFFRGVMKMPKAPMADFELEVERIAWDIVEHRLDITRDQSETARKLFCIYNRFCDPNDLPLYMTEKAMAFLCRELCRDMLEGFDGSLEAFISHFMRENPNKVWPSLKSTYDRYVRDVLIEERLNVKFASGSRSQSMISRPIQLTTNYIKVFDDDFLDPCYQTVPKLRNPRGDPIFVLSTLQFEVVEEDVKSLLGKVIHHVLSIRGVPEGHRIDLMFHPQRDIHSRYKWSEMLKEIKTLQESKSTPLENLHQKHWFNEERRSKSNLSSRSSSNADLGCSSSQSWAPENGQHLFVRGRPSYGPSETESAVSDVSTGSKMDEDVSGPHNDDYNDYANIEIVVPPPPVKPPRHPKPGNLQDLSRNPINSTGLYE